MMSSGEAAGGEQVRVTVGVRDRMITIMDSAAVDSRESDVGKTS